MSAEIAIPFRLDTSGQIAVEKDADRQIRQHVMSLVNTEPTDRVMIPEYGIPLSEAVFEDDEAVVGILGDAIQAAFTIWEPGVVLQEVAKDPSDQPQDGQAVLTVEYRRADSAETPDLGTKSNVAVIGIDGEVSEVVRG